MDCRRLARATFVDETDTGWQQVNFESPVPVSANTTYVASYFAPNGGYANDSLSFSAADIVRSPLTAVRATTTAGNGLFKYGGGFPNESYNDTNYWVDVVFAPTP